ncbi:MAG: sensor histidine kinase, partial [Clostridium sp.]
KEMASMLRGFVNESLQDVRIAVNQLKPSEYELYEGIFRIEDLVKNFSKLTGIEVTFRVSKNMWGLTSKQSTNLYRMVQEGLSNASRHGKATQIKMNLNFSEEGLVVILEDNGIGCSEINESGLGLKSIRERAVELQGSVKYSSKLGGGFKIKITISKDGGGEVYEVVNSGR